MESVVSEAMSRLGSGSRERHTSRSRATLSRSTSGEDAVRGAVHLGPAQPLPGRRRRRDRRRGAPARRWKPRCPSPPSPASRLAAERESPAPDCPSPPSPRLAQRFSTSRRLHRPDAADALEVGGEQIHHPLSQHLHPGTRGVEGKHRDGLRLFGHGDRARPGDEPGDRARRGRGDRRRGDDHRRPPPGPPVAARLAERGGAARSCRGSDPPGRSPSRG